MTTYSQMYIDGQWVASTGTGSISVFDSTNEQVMATIPEGTADDVKKAAAAAKAAFDSWSALAPAQRAEYLNKIGDALAARMDEIGSVISRETGMNKPFSNMIQVGLPINSFKQAAAVAQSFEYSRQIGSSSVVREPVGVVGCITPWNYPLHQIAAKVAFALASGCTVVLKPSEVAPVDAFMLAEIIHEAGLPKGVFNLVTGTGPVVGEAIAASADIDMVSFTGSTGVGVRIMEAGAATMKRQLLELGGKGAGLVLHDADIAKAVGAIQSVWAFHSGQICTAPTRAIVHRSRYDELVAALANVAPNLKVGDPTAMDTLVGPVISAAQRGRIEGYIQAGADEGAEIIVDGRRPAHMERGFYVAPTLIAGCTPTMTPVQEEIFGPVLCVVRVNSLEEAMKLINDHEYGNGTCIFTRDGEAARLFCDEIEVGMVGVNVPLPVPVAYHSFGGWKRSLFGDLHAYGPDGVRFYTRRKAITQRWPQRASHEASQFAFPSL